MAAALGALSNIDSVRVSAASSVAGDNYQYTWTVTFNADWTAPGKLVPLWRAAGCGNCTEFSFLPASGEDQVTVTVRSQMGPFVQLQALRADDRRNGDRFGWAVAMDGNQIAVGAPYSAALTTTTWDFEAGTLLGWRKSGSAFDLQPTFADNSYLHSVQGSSPRPRSQAANSAGRYYIGTAERRPGNPADYSSPHPAYPQGGTQGDGPTGTLSSAVFMIPAGGTRISFLVGGGCDIYTEFVELLVDGLSVAKRTGLCSEKMAPAHFDVSSLAGRAAQIRIVDASSGSWGHINADSFSFDWDVAGATVRGAANQKVTTGGVVETPRSGAMYLFRRRAGVGEAMQCDGAEETCVWSQEAVFTASDKRANTFFGDSVAVNDAAGIVAVGAPGAALRGFYKEAPSVFPHQNASTGASLAAGIHFPVAAANMPLFQSEGVYMPERSGAFGVWALLDEAGVRPDPRAYEESGAVYVFVKSHATVSNTGVITEPQTWRPIEHAKLQPPDAFARDHFGASVCISGTTLSVGAPGQDGAGADAGAAYVYRAAFAAISFSEVRRRFVSLLSTHLSSRLSLPTTSDRIRRLRGPQQARDGDSAAGPRRLQRPGGARVRHVRPDRQGRGLGQIRRVHGAVGARAGPSGLRGLRAERGAGGDRARGHVGRVHGAGPRRPVLRALLDIPAGDAVGAGVGRPAERAAEREGAHRRQRLWVRGVLLRTQGEAGRREETVCIFVHDCVSVSIVVWRTVRQRLNDVVK